MPDEEYKESLHFRADKQVLTVARFFDLANFGSAREAFDSPALSIMLANVGLMSRARGSMILCISHCSIRQDKLQSHSSKPGLSGLHFGVYPLLNQGHRVREHPIRNNGLTLVITIDSVKEMEKRCSILGRTEGITKPVKFSLSVDNTEEEVDNCEFQLLKVSED